VSPRRDRSEGRLGSGELAEAAVLSDVALVLSVAAWLLPGGVVLWPFAMVPSAVVVARHRLRAGVIGGFAVSLLALMVGGVGLAGNVRRRSSEAVGPGRASKLLTAGQPQGGASTPRRH
jgi:hypothetical protein